MNKLCHAAMTFPPAGSLLADSRSGEAILCLNCNFNSQPYLKGGEIDLRYLKYTYIFVKNECIPKLFYYKINANLQCLQIFDIIFLSQQLRSKI